MKGLLLCISHSTFVQFEVSEVRLHFTLWIGLGYQASWYVFRLLNP